MTYPAGYRYTKSHEWIKVVGNKAKVGLTNYAQDKLGDITFVELPDLGKKLKRGEVFGVVESVKAVSDCYCPASGKVSAVNNQLEVEPDFINRSPHDDGWIMELELDSLAELDTLMDVDTYTKFAAAEEDKG
ncbi:MAG TPA: glycine cleavage system protein GcvH [Clostridiales bacterium UBA8153]|nr:glycine cleavage system protein GcvH [Clostridiales bacterium UBA8153]